VRHYCTYFDSRYLPKGLALYRSLCERSTEEFTLWVLVFDAVASRALKALGRSNVRVIEEEAFDRLDAGLAGVKNSRSRVEYYWTCTPVLPRVVLDLEPSLDMVAYLDADMFFFADPAFLFWEMGPASVGIVGHRYAPEHAHFEAVSGVYNVGFLAFRNDPHGRACLEGWRERCLEWCHARFEEGRFGDQMYLNEWPSRFAGVKVLEQPGAVVGPWNLSRYALGGPAGAVTANGAPLVCCHFHGLTAVGRGIVEPADYTHYRLSGAAIRRLYLPYCRALAEATAEANRLTGAVPASPRLSLGTLLRAIAIQRFLVTRPAALGVALWQLGGLVRRLRAGLGRGCP
jgi:hypothetical protein